MGIRTILTAICLGAAVLVHGQALDDYLKVRRQLKIEGVSSGSAVLSLVGTRAFEVRGTVQGLSQMSGLTYVMFRSEDEQLLNIKTRSLPDWINANETVVRLLVKATRENDTAEFTAFLVGAIPDVQIAPVESQEKQRNTTVPRGNGSQSSRSSWGIRGTIGPAGTRVESNRSWSMPKSDATPIYAGFIKRRNPRLSDDEAYRIAAGVIGFSLQYKVDARLIMAILIVESGFNPSATSRSGAMGLGQLMPATAAGLGISRPYDTVENLYGTVRTIRGHLERYHKKTGGDGFQSLILALAAYNAGSGAVRRHGGVPPYAQTQNYVQKVTAIYMQLTGQG